MDKCDVCGVQGDVEIRFSPFNDCLTCENCFHDKRAEFLLDKCIKDSQKREYFENVSKALSNGIYFFENQLNNILPYQVVHNECLKNIVSHTCNMFGWEYDCHAPIMDSILDCLDRVRKCNHIDAVNADLILTIITHHVEFEGVIQGLHNLKLLKHTVDKLNLIHFGPINTVY